MEINKKKWAAIIAGIIAVLTAILGLLNSGCTAIESKKLASAIEDTRDAAAIVCTVAEQFEAAGIEVPGVEKCADILPVLTGGELDSVVEILKCGEDNEVKSTEFIQCATAAGWPQIKKRLQQLE